MFSLIIFLSLWYTFTGYMDDLSIDIYTDKEYKMETQKKKYQMDSDEKKSAFRAGLISGIPIGLGYLAVSFSLGIAARNAGLTAPQGFIVSLLCMASAGEYVGFLSIAALASYLEIAVATFVANARYLLMSTAMSQRMDPLLPLRHRILMAFGITDELFGIAISRPGYMNPYFSYGSFLVAALPWSAGTSLGIIAGNLLPLRLVSAFSVALYGMFLAVIIPPARKDKIIAGLIVICFAASYAASCIPFLRDLTDGTRTILLTVVISALAAIAFPKEIEK